MRGQQAVSEVDPIDQLVPPAGGRGRLVLLVIGAFVVLGLAAVSPMSGVVRPNLAFDDRVTGSAGNGAGQWDLVVANRGWTTATMDHFDLGLPGVEVVETTYLALAPGLVEPPNFSSVPVAIGAASSGPVSVRPGEGVIVRLRFTYDCERLGGVPRSTVQARGAPPLWFSLELGSGVIRSGVPGLLDFACTHP